jgi:glycosyltransferase involved in cell wall biosynthesis
MTALSTVQESPRKQSAIQDASRTVSEQPDSLRIAVIGSRGIPSSYSGVERIVEELFEIVAAAGHLVTVYCRPEVLEQPTGMYKGIRLVRTPAPGGKYFETLSHSFASTVHAIMQGDIHDGGKPFDLVSYHTIAPGIFSPLPRMARIPIVNHVHGLDWQREKWRGLGSVVLRRCERTMVRYATQIIGVNRDIVHYYRSNYAIDVKLLPNGVNQVSDDFSPDLDVLKSFDLEPRKYAVSIGRLVPEKRIHDTIAAFARVPGECKMAFVGAGKHSGEYVKRIHEQAKSDPRVVFTGQQQGRALESLFRSARVYVTASELEGLPSSLLECMERKIPVVASDIPPHRELLGNVRDYDWFFPVGGVAELATLITAGLTDEARARHFGDGAREFVRTNYAWPKLAGATLGEYRALVTAARERSA